MKHNPADLNDMAIFAEIARTGGITAAAKAMGLPKSNISRRLARLEERLGVTLVERTTRSSRLTSIGRCYADGCTAMLEDARAADNIIEHSRADPIGELRVSASIMVGQYIISRALASYCTAYPEVQVLLELSNSKVNLIEDGFDLALRIGDNPDSSLIGQELGVLPMGLYAAPAYLQRNPAPQHPDDLLKHRCLIMERDATVKDWPLTRRGTLHSFHITGAVIINDFTALKNLALRGGGIVLMPTYAAAEELQSGLLVPVLPGWQGQASRLSALYPSRRGAHVKLRAFIDHVRQALAACET